MHKPQVGIASVWFEGNPCNMHLLDLAEKVKEGVDAAGLVGLRFNTIGVSDGISMGTDGMSFSLQSRDLIADSIETVMCRAVVRRQRLHSRLRQEHARLPDGHGPAEPARPDDLRRHHPRRVIWTTKSSTSSPPSRATANFWPQRSTKPQRATIVRHAVPAPEPAAACTPPTPWPPRSRRWACRCPTAHRRPRKIPRKLDECVRAGAAIRTLLELDLKPRDIMTRERLRKRYGPGHVPWVVRPTRCCICIAMARSVGVPLAIDDFQKISNTTPLLADFKPSGAYVMEDLQAVGGAPAVIKYAARRRDARMATASP